MNIYIKVIHSNESFTSTIQSGRYPRDFAIQFCMKEGNPVAKRGD